jgi:hypothetical protein
VWSVQAVGKSAQQFKSLSDCVTVTVSQSARYTPLPTAHRYDLVLHILPISSHLHGITSTRMCAATLNRAR